MSEEDRAKRRKRFFTPEFRAGAAKLALEKGVPRSMRRTGDCWDNAVAESFFSTLKTELIHEHRGASRSQARERSSSTSSGTTPNVSARRTAIVPQTKQNATA